MFLLNRIMEKLSCFLIYRQIMDRWIDSHESLFTYSPRNRSFRIPNMFLEASRNYRMHCSPMAEMSAPSFAIEFGDRSFRLVPSSLIYTLNIYLHSSISHILDFSTRTHSL